MKNKIVAKIKTIYFRCRFWATIVSRIKQINSQVEYMQPIGRIRKIQEILNDYNRKH